MTLEAILTLELQRIPDLHFQAPLLRYRYLLLQDLEATVDVDHVKLFNLIPNGNFHRTFHLLDKYLLAHLAPRTADGFLVDYGAGVVLSELLPLVFDMDKLNELLPKEVIGEDGIAVRPLVFGDSILTDGIQLQVHLVSAAHVAKKRQRLATAAANRVIRAAGGEVPVRARRPAQGGDAAVLAQRRFLVARRIMAANLFILPPNARVVGCDPGIVNILTLCKETIDPVTLEIGGPDTPTVISRARYRQETGVAPQVKALARRVAAHRLVAPIFTIAENLVAGVRTKTANQVQLIAALKIRGLHFETLYAFYSLEVNARIRFANYMGIQRFADKLADKIFDRPQTVLVIGDGKFVGGARRVITRLKQRGDVRMFDEFRTTMLDSRLITNHEMLYNPPQKMMEQELRNGGVRRYLKRIHGMKQCASSGLSYLWNRDKNAAVNILQNFVLMCTTGEIPERFRRGGAPLVKPRSLFYGYRNRPGGEVGFSRFMMRGWVEPQQQQQQQ